MDRTLQEKLTDNQIYLGFSRSELHALEPYRDPTARPTSGFYTDFSGVKTRLSYFPPIPGLHDQLVGDLPFPDDGIHAEAVEYLAAIKSVNAADDSFTAVELGAGYGPWLAFTAKAAQRKGISQIKLIAVEADPDRRALMQTHFSDNDLPSIDPQSAFSSAESDSVSVESYLGAVGEKNGKLTFASAGILDWGGSVFAGCDDGGIDNRGEKIQTYEVDCYTIEHVIRDLPIVDYLHIDIQGYEYLSITASLATLRAKVRFMLVETHSRIIEGQLLELLHGKGWRLINEKPCKFRHDAPLPLDALVQLDGSQLWVNLDLVDSTRFDVYNEDYRLRAAEYRAEQLDKVVRAKDEVIWALEAELKRFRKQSS